MGKGMGEGRRRGMEGMEGKKTGNGREAEEGVVVGKQVGR